MPGEAKTKGYCVKCKVSGEIKDPSKKKSKNDRNMVCGKCSKCDGKICTFVKNDA